MLINYEYNLKVFLEKSFSKVSKINYDSSLVSSSLVYFSTSNFFLKQEGGFDFFGLKSSLYISFLSFFFLTK